MKIRHAYVIDPSSHNTTPENQIWVNSVVGNTSYMLSHVIVGELSAVHRTPMREDKWMLMPGLSATCPLCFLPCWFQSPSFTVTKCNCECSSFLCSVSPRESLNPRVILRTPKHNFKILTVGNFPGGPVVKNLPFQNTLWHTSQQDPLWPTSQNIGNKSKNKQMGPN